MGGVGGRGPVGGKIESGGGKRGCVTVSEGKKWKKENGPPAGRGKCSS